MAPAPLTPNRSPPATRQLAARPVRRWLHLPQNRPRRLLFVGIYLFFCWGVAFLGIKLFWNFYAAVPLGHSPRTLDFFYPEVRRSNVERLHPRHDDDHFDVLLLGGSVLTSAWGSVEELLAEKLREATGNRFRVFNLARPAHTSRDSLIKYWLVADEQFDLVLLYDGINDVRMNLCPRRDFRDDYSHCTWYREVEEALNAGRISRPIPLSGELALVTRGIHLQDVAPGMVEFGREIKTVGPLRRNLEEIVCAARTRGDPIVLSTFAYDLPVALAGEKAASPDRELVRRYSDTPWGRAVFVAATLDAQNAAICDLAGEYPEVSLIDEEKLMADRQRLFVDPCHLTEEGCRQFVENLWPAVAMRLAEWRTARGRR